MILPLEKQVSSLELSKRLKELGVKQMNANFFWHLESKFPTLGNRSALMSSRFQKVYAAAFTVAELGEMLPARLDNRTTLNLYKCPNKSMWACDYDEFEGRQALYYQEADTEADTRAKMLIHLIEQGSIKL